MTTYDYYFGNIRTNQILERIPLYGVSMDDMLSGIGNLNGSFNLDQTGKSNEDLVAATIPGRSYIVAERDGVPIWSGIVWGNTYQSQAKNVQLTARTFAAYPERQFIETAFERLNTEQRNIFRDLWLNMQSDPNRDINVNVPSAFPNAILKSVTVKPDEFRNYGEIMSAVSDGDDGFDWNIDVRKDSSSYVWNLRIGYPTLGAKRTEGDPTFNYPGNILNYFETASIGSSGTNIFGLGEGEGESMLISKQVHQDLLNSGGWVRYDRDVALKHITNQVTLDAVTRQEAAIRRPPMTVIKPGIRASIDPVFGSYRLGDACNLQIKDARHPKGLLVATRVTSWNLHPQSADSPEEVFIVLDGVDDGE